MADQENEALLYGLKQITYKNWDQPDLPTLYEVTSSQWVAEVLKPKLDTSVPQKVDELFQIARGSMVYGWFYYPLITLACE